MTPDVVEHRSHGRQTNASRGDDNILAQPIIHRPPISERPAYSQDVSYIHTGNGGGDIPNGTDGMADTMAVCHVRADRNSRFTQARHLQHVELPSLKVVTFAQVRV